MILKDLFELNIENKEKYHFVFLLMEILMLYQQIIK